MTSFANETSASYSVADDENGGHDFDFEDDDAGVLVQPSLRSRRTPGAVRPFELQELDVERDILPNDESLETRTGGGRYLLIGRPASGKSTLIRDLLYYKRNFLPVAVAVSTTEAMNHFYASIMPSLFVYNHFSPDILSDFIGHQKNKIEKGLEYPSTFGAFVMDDCSADSKIIHDRNLEDILKNGRHMNVFFLMANQYVLDMAPKLRVCFDGVFILRNANMSDRKKIHENFASAIQPFSEFNRLMDEATEDHRVIFVDNRSTSNDWRACFKTYRAEKREAFSIGAPAYQRFSADRLKV